MRCLVAIVALSLLSGGITARAESPGSAGDATRVRASALAGSWYPEARVAVAAEVHRMLRAAREAPTLPAPPLALVVPHAGWRFSGSAAAAAFRNLHRGDFARVVVVGTAHHGSFAGFSVPDPSVAAYRTPLGDVPLCRDVLASLRDGGLVDTRGSAHDREHSIEIELPFLQVTLGEFCLVPILAGHADARAQEQLAGRLAALHDGATLYVFSSDFTHYGPRYRYTPFGPSAIPAKNRIRELDDRAVRLVSALDPGAFRDYLRETGATICGRHGLGVLTELVPKLDVTLTPVELARYTSLDVPGFEDANSVSYVALAFVEKAPTLSPPPLRAPAQSPVCTPAEAPIDAELGKHLVRVARASIHSHLLESDQLDRALAGLPPHRTELDRTQGVFVTLNRTDPDEIRTKGRLRGCIGQIVPTYPLFEAVVVAGVSAAVNDRRFPPVRPDELDDLEVEVTVLSPPHPVADWQEIALGTHGIVLRRGENSAVFLPQVATEQGWTLPETLSHLARKAGLPAGAWREGCTLEVFTGQVFHEVRDGS